MPVTAGTLETWAERLDNALDIYARIVEEELADAEYAELSEESKRYIAECCENELDSATRPGVVLAAKINELYLEARKQEAMYIEQAREQGQTDWGSVVTETASIREAARRVHTAGFEAGPDHDESGYVLPEEMCPASLVSMNAGSAPFTVDDRVTQYEAFARHFDVTPEVVYYPGAGQDVSPSAAFPESRVVYADVDAAAMDELDKAGYETVSADATAHELETGADVILFQNAGLMEESIVERNLREGGWVLANNHLESAEHVDALETVELVGVIPDENRRAVNTLNLDGYLSRIDTEPESAVDPDSQLPLTKGSSLDTYVFRAKGR
ncbi:hypothetical protein [Halovenus sp. HT40]|uniref:hypothetical protein n=1 Tax=Halovenus sp. HT40 TaxID=3126691 RepID=UPI00300F2833